MREGLFWLDDLQWSSIKGCLQAFDGKAAVPLLKPLPPASAPIVIATRSSVLPPQGRTPRRYPLRQKRPELPQRRLLDRRHLLLVKLSLDPG